jgi:hypothetical protein
MTEESRKSSAGLGLVGDTGAVNRIFATIIGGVADLMAQDKCKFAIVAFHEMHQSCGNANQGGIREYLHIPGDKEGTIRDDNRDVWILDAEATGDGRYPLDLRAG